MKIKNNKKLPLLKMTFEVKEKFNAAVLQCLDYENQFKS